MSAKYPIPYKQDQVYFQYNVKDFNRAKSFYMDVLGFETVWDGGEEAGWAELALPVTGARLGLNLRREGEIQRGSGTLTLVVEDLDATREYLIGKGVEATEIEDIPDMVSYFNIDDTEGNAIQIVSDPRVKSSE
ncbi:MAG: VOC family protein [Candidatus Thorarchaeota archaeon]|nr:MAG: VOC family protein [Candidatus Thorarchaeota archaeon]